MIHGDDGGMHGDQHIDNYSLWSPIDLKPIICSPPAVVHLSFIQNSHTITNKHTHTNKMLLV